MKADIPFAGLGKLAILALVGLSCWSLLWGGGHALEDSADLGRRIEEIGLFRKGHDPYSDPDATYPPSAWFVFDVLIPAWSEKAVRILWLVLNLGALVALAEGVRRWLPRETSRFRIAAVLLAMAASKPVRAGIALGAVSSHPLGAGGLVRCVDGGRPAPAGGGFAWTGTGEADDGAAGSGSGACTGPFRGPGLGRLHAGAGSVPPAWLRRSPVVLLTEWLRNARTQEAAGTIDLPTLLSRWGFDEVISSSSLTLLLLVGSGLVFWRFRKVELTGLASLALVISALFAYHRHYDLVLLLPASGWLASRSHRSWRSVMGVAMALFLIVPVHPGPLRGLAPWYDAFFVALSYAFGLALVLELETQMPSCRAGFSRPELRTSEKAV